MNKLALLAVLVLTGCAAHKPVHTSIPVACIKGVFLPNDAPKSSDCTLLKNGHILCRNFEAEVNWPCVPVSAKDAK